MISFFFFFPFFPLRYPLSSPHSVMLLSPLPLIIAYPPSPSLSPSSSLCDPREAAVVIRSVPSDIPSLFVSSAPCEPPRQPLSRIQYALSLELLISCYFFFLLLSSFFFSFVFVRCLSLVVFAGVCLLRMST